MCIQICRKTPPKYKSSICNCISCAHDVQKQLPQNEKMESLFKKGPRSSTAYISKINKINIIYGLRRYVCVFTYSLLQ